MRLEEKGADVWVTVTDPSLPEDTVVLGLDQVMLGEKVVVEEPPVFLLLAGVVRTLELGPEDPVFVDPSGIINVCASP